MDGSQFMAQPPFFEKLGAFVIEYPNFLIEARPKICYNKVDFV